MNQFEVKEAIIKVLREHLICIDKDYAREEHLQNTDIIVSESWIAGKVINEIKNERQRKANEEKK